MNIILVFSLILFVYMVEDGRQRWHKCEFPHSWDNEIEYIIDTKMAVIYYG